MRALGFAACAVAVMAATGTADARSPVPRSGAGTTELAPHRAIYAMDLATLRPGAGLAGATGTMSYAFEDACDGWVVENRIAMNYTYSEGGQALSTTDFLTWEAKDGLSYRFRMRNTRDGEIMEEIEGKAELTGKGQGGTVTFTRPEPMVVALPKGTLFPTDHTIRLLDTARAGGKTMLKVVFDGSGMDGPYEVNAVIGKVRPGTGGGPSGSASSSTGLNSPLIAEPSWPMRIAFFPISSTEASPEFEMMLGYHPNGIAHEIEQSFKSFSLKGRLEMIEASPKRPC